MTSITLVGRASQLAFREFESGATQSSFTLTVNARGEQLPPVVKCYSWGLMTIGQEIREKFEQMDEGSLVSVSGDLIESELGIGIMPLLVFVRLELLNEPLPVVVEEPEPQDWHDHPSLTAEERNPSLCR
jgi:hypothetical protein